MKTNQGLIRTILFIVIIIIVISYFGFDLKDIINDPQTQSNFSFIWDFLVNLWNNYLKVPAMWIWNHLLLPLWEILKEGLGNLDNLGTPPQP
jgi:hypothetical protein